MAGAAAPAAASVTSAAALAESLPSATPATISHKATLGAGCYWGTEKFIRKDWAKQGGLVDCAVGFMGPESAKANPTYREVCSGKTGHVEVLDVEWQDIEGKDGAETYENLIRFFFSFHDPTTFNRQGNDVGTQYASVIFVYDQLQLEIANRVIGELQELVNNKKVPRYQSVRVSTAVRAATTFYPAHEEHQDYLNKNPQGYCNHGWRFKGWPEL